MNRSSSKQSSEGYEVLSPYDSPNKVRHGYIAGLDGLRAIAIFTVLLTHGFQFAQFRQYGAGGELLSVVWMHLGVAGVKLFFAISGYLICTRFANELNRHTPGVALLEFYIRRAFRILPAVLPYLICLALLGKIGEILIHQSEILAASLFYSNYLSTKSWYTGHFWSLSVEEHFYILWAPTLAFAGRKKSAAVAAIVIAASAFIRPILLSGTADQAHVLEKTHMQLDSFMFPCLLAIWLLTPTGHRILSGIASTGSIVVITALLATLPKLVSSYGAYLDFRSIEALSFALIAILPGLNPNALLTRCLELPLLKWVGHRSYSIYIWQMLIFVPRNTGISEKIGMFAFHCLLVFPIAELSYRFVELPMIALGRSLVSRLAIRRLSNQTLST